MFSFEFFIVSSAHSFVYGSALMKLIVERGIYVRTCILGWPNIKENQNGMKRSGKAYFADHLPGITNGLGLSSSR